METFVDPGLVLSRHESDQLRRMTDELREALRITDSLYEADRLDEAEQWEAKAEWLAQKLEEFVAHLSETEAEEPKDQLDPLAAYLAYIYAEYLQGFPRRHGTTLPELTRHIVSMFDYTASVQATDEQLIEAAQDAYEWHKALRQRRAAAPAERARIRRGA